MYSQQRQFGGYSGLHRFSVNHHLTGGRRKNIPFSLLLFEQHISSLRSLDTDTGCNQLRSVPYKQRPVSRIFVTDYGIVRFHFHSLIGCGLRRIRQRENMVSTPVFTFHTDTGKVFQTGLFRIEVRDRLNSRRLFLRTWFINSNKRTVPCFSMLPGNEGERRLLLYMIRKWLPPIRM